MANASLVVHPSVVWGRPGAVGGDFAAYHALPSFVPGFASAPLGVFCVDTSDPVLALTYDDGPHPEHTPRILDLLGERGLKATFFVLGRQAALYPEIVRRTVAEGHELALHGHDHSSLRTMSTLTAVRRIRDARHRVEDIAGVRIRTYRPPYGAYSLAQAVGIWALGLKLLIWSGDAIDWVDDDEQAIADRALASAMAGAVLLLHDDRGDSETVRSGEELPSFDRAEVLRRLLDGLDARGFSVRSSEELMRRFANVRSMSPAA